MSGISIVVSIKPLTHFQKFPIRQSALHIIIIIIMSVTQHIMQPADVEAHSLIVEYKSCIGEAASIATIKKERLIDTRY